MPASPSKQPTVPQALALLPLFAGAEEAALECLHAGARVVRCRARQVVVEQGTQAAMVLVVLAGKVKVALLHKDGRESVVAVLGPGEMVGELGVLGGAARAAHVEMLEAGSVLSIPGPVFLAAMAVGPTLSLAVARMLAARVRLMGEHVQLLAGANAQSRLASKLLTLVERFGEPSPDGTTLRLRLTQSDLAALADLSRQRTNQLLQGMLQAGVLARRGSWLVVLDMRELERLAQA